jgi:hypothetical protein
MGSKRWSIEETTSPRIVGQPPPGRRAALFASTALAGERVKCFMHCGSAAARSRRKKSFVEFVCIAEVRAM